MAGCSCGYGRDGENGRVLGSFQPVWKGFWVDQRALKPTSHMALVELVVFEKAQDATSSPAHSPPFP